MLFSMWSYFTRELVGFVVCIRACLNVCVLTIHAQFSQNRAYIRALHTRNTFTKIYAHESFETHTPARFCPITGTKNIRKSVRSPLFYTLHITTLDMVAIVSFVCLFVCMSLCLCVSVCA